MKSKYSKIQKKIWIQKYRNSGLSKKDFCHEYGLNYHTLSAWLHYEKSNEKANTELKIIPLEEENITSKEKSPIEMKKEKTHKNKITFRIKLRIKIPKLISFQWGGVFSNELP